MNWLIKFTLVSTFLMIQSAASGALPPGLARIYSIYTDRTSHKEAIVTGYGIVIETLWIESPKKPRKQYLLQTVSHLSQGGYGDMNLSDPSPADGEQKPVPKLLVEIGLQNNKSLFIHHAWTRGDQDFKEVLQGKPSEPLISSSYFESFRDTDLMILNSRDSSIGDFPAFLKISLEHDNKDENEFSIKNIEFPELKIESDWSWNLLGNHLAVLCPNEFAFCKKDHTIQFEKNPNTILGKRLFKDGFIEGEYDKWIPFDTEMGMSGLPVISINSQGVPDGIVGLISGSSLLTHDTWLSEINPIKQFYRWSSAVKEFQKSNQIFKVYGYGDFIWILDKGQLVRVGEIKGEVRLQESYISPENNSESPSLKLSPKENNQKEDVTLRNSNGGGFRHDNGGGFRHDNGGGFRHDNGDNLQYENPSECSINKDSKCPPYYKKGRFFATQSPGEETRKTAFMMVSHSKNTQILPPTVTGMGYYFLQTTLEQAQKQYLPNAPNPLKFLLYTSDLEKSIVHPLKKKAFENFLSHFLKTKNPKLWEEKLKVLIADKASDFNLKMKTAEGVLRLTPNYSNKNILLSVKVEVELDNKISFSKVIDYQSFFNENSIANLHQEISIGNQRGWVNWSGILTYNPDYINIPDIDVEFDLKKSLMKYLNSEGDINIKSLFSFTLEKSIYYCTIEH